MSLPEQPFSTKMLDSPNLLENRLGEPRHIPLIYKMGFKDIARSSIGLNQSTVALPLTT